MEWSVGLEFVAKAVARNFEIGKLQVDQNLVKLQVDAEDENILADHDMKYFRFLTFWKLSK